MKFSAVKGNFPLADLENHIASLKSVDLVPIEVPQG